MIEFFNITKSFQEKTVIKNISGEFKSSKINMIIGGSGAGKSILVKCILGILAIDKGEVLFNKQSFSRAKKSTELKMKRKIGVLFQGGALFSNMSVLENVKLPLDMLTDLSERKKIERIYACLEAVELQDSRRKFPTELSGGMQKRVGLARAIVNNPKYLFCDEPNSGLDPQTAVVIDNLIQKITTKHKITTIIVTHDINSILNLGENILFLYKGEKIWEGSAEELLKTQNQIVNDFIFASKIIKDRCQVNG